MILVFGGHGQLGRELVRSAAARGVPVTALTRSDADIAEPTDVSRVIGEIGPSLVINAAAYTKVDMAETDVEAAERANCIGPGVIAAACASAEVPLVHVSTDYVFDGRKADPYAEDDPIAPLNVYGRTKADGERAVRAAHRRHIILRTSWLYGEFGHNFLKTVLCLAAENDELRIVADQRGCPTSTRTLADAVQRIAPRLVAGEDLWGTYHFAGTGVVSWHGFAARIVAAQAALTGRHPRVVAVNTAEHPTPARRPANSALDCRLFAATFGFRGRPWTEETDAIAAALASARQGNGRQHVA